jgi:hypothetical protein
MRDFGKSNLHQSFPISIRVVQQQNSVNLLSDINALTCSCFEYAIHGLMIQTYRAFDQAKQKGKQIDMVIHD